MSLKTVNVVRIHRSSTLLHHLLVLLRGVLLVSEIRLGERLLLLLLGLHDSIGDL